MNEARRQSCVWGGGLMAGPSADLVCLRGRQSSGEEAGSLSSQTKGPAVLTEALRRQDPGGRVCGEVGRLVLL